MQGQPFFLVKTSFNRQHSNSTHPTRRTEHFIWLDWVVTTSTLSIVTKKKSSKRNKNFWDGSDLKTFNVPINVGRDITYLPRAGKVVAEMISTRSAFNGRFSLFFKVPVVGTLCANNYITVEKVKQTTLKKTYVLGIS